MLRRLADLRRGLEAVVNATSRPDQNWAPTADRPHFAVQIDKRMFPVSALRLTGFRRKPQ